jgi:hypothetical protein
VKIQLKSFALGFGFACLSFVGAIAAFLTYPTDISQNAQPTVRQQTLPSGKTVEVTSFNLLWGVEHEERRSRDDTFGLEYVSSAAKGDVAALDREISEVFELIRPISEQWGFNIATISAFPTAKRKGWYYIYSFRREPQGKWTFDRKQTKVFIND